jgi:segregation and condensation protein B
MKIKKETKQLFEAILFLENRPLSREVLIDRLNIREWELDWYIEDLRHECARRESGLELAETPAGIGFKPIDILQPMLQIYYPKIRKKRISKSSLETLAIIAYNQPATKAEVERIRGVDCGGTIQTLLQETLIEIHGRKEIPGRPLLYRTSDEFLIRFGLKSIKDLPVLEEIKSLEFQLGDPKDTESENEELVQEDLPLIKF